MKSKFRGLFGFADQKKTTYGLGYSLTLKGNNKNDFVADVATIEIKQISWFIPTYIHIISYIHL